MGTPYTLFFRGNLYKTFMEAYLAVDGHVRRKMEETLRTWKQPVPQSLDDRPVFPPEVTEPIEDALNKARSSAMALQQQQQASRPGYAMGRARGVGPDRATPTPPGMRPGPGYQMPPHHMQANGSRPTSAQPPQHRVNPYPVSLFSISYMSALRTNIKAAPPELRRPAQRAVAGPRAVPVAGRGCRRTEP